MVDIWNVSPFLTLTVALLAADPAGGEARATLVPRLSTPVSTPAPVDLRLRDPSARELAAPARARRPSMLASGAGFLLGDALAFGVFGASWLLVSNTHGEDAMGVALIAFEYTAIAAVMAPPMLGTYLGAGGSGVPGTLRAFLVGAALHVGGLVGAATLARHDARWLAAGLMVAVDLGVAPWAVTRMIGAARAPGGAGDAISRAHPVPAVEHGMRR